MDIILYRCTINTPLSILPLYPAHTSFNNVRHCVVVVVGVGVNIILTLSLNAAKNVYVNLNDIVRERENKVE